MAYKPPRTPEYTKLIQRLAEIFSINQKDPAWEYETIRAAYIASLQPFRWTEHIESIVRTQLFDAKQGYPPDYLVVFFYDKPRLQA